MVGVVLGMLLLEVWIAVTAWSMVPKALRQATLLPGRFPALVATVLLGLILGSGFVVSFGSPPWSFVHWGLMVTVVALASPAIPLLCSLAGIARLSEVLPGRRGTTRARAGLVIAAITSVVLAVISLRLVSLASILFIPLYAAIHVLAFARGWWSPVAVRVVVSLSIGVAIAWGALPLTHVELPLVDRWPEPAWPDYTPNCAAGFPLLGILGSMNAAAPDQLHPGKGLGCMLLNVVSCSALTGILTSPIPSQRMRRWLYPALLGASAGMVVGTAYLIQILD